MTGVEDRIASGLVTEQDLARDAITVLTRAARLTRLTEGGMVVPMDFSGFIAQVLASVAANVGGIDELLDGRPGSWEANYVHSLLFGTIGPDPQDLLRHRTEPIVVRLNVPSLVADLVSAGDAPGGVSSYDDVVDRVPEPDAEAHSEAWDLFSDTLADLLERYRKAYAAYGQAFTDAVLAYAQTLPELRDTYGGLLVPVVVVVEADPESDGEEVENPSEFDDPLVWKLWEYAFRTVSLPVVAEPAP